MLVEGSLSPAAPAATPHAPAQTVVVAAAGSHVDYNTDTASFTDVVVSQGGTRISAERCQANGLGFSRSTWTFEGNVIVQVQPQAELRSQRATIEIRDDRVTRAMATGDPATFEAQRTGSRPPVRGQANNVVYDAREDTVRLSGEAWLSAGQDERITGPLLIYGIRNESLVAASPGGGQQVHITVPPPTKRKPGLRQPPARERPQRRPPS